MTATHLPIASVLCARCGNDLALVRAEDPFLPGRARLQCRMCMVLYDPRVDTGVRA